MKNRSQTSVILVHGAFADATIWQKVLQLVEKAGLFVTAVQLALKSIVGGPESKRCFRPSRKKPI
jgi:hypothetical protein